MIAGSGVEQFVNRVRRLYSLPAVAVKVLELTDRDDVDIHALRDCIENDPALTTKILRVVNSSLFGLSSPVSDLNQALALLGTKPLKLLVLGFSLSSELFVGATGTIVARYWRHTLTQAVAARQLAEKFGHLAGDEAFIAALLGELGMLVLVQEIGQPYARFVERILASRGDIVEIERSALGFDHVQLTAGLLERWCLPRALVEAVVASRADAPPATDVSHVLRISRLVADLLVDHRYDRLSQLLNADAGGRCLSSAELTDLVTELESKVGRLADVLSLELPAGVDYRDILIEAHHRLSETAVEVATEMASLGAAGEADPQNRQALGLWKEVEDLSSAMQRLANRSERSRTAATGKPKKAGPSGTAGEKSPAPGRSTAPEPPPLRWHEIEEPHVASTSVIVGTELDLRSRLLSAVSYCRQARCPLSLILVEIDRFGDLALALGPLEALEFVERLGKCCLELGVAEQVCIQTSEARFAVILPAFDRNEAVALADTLVRRAGCVLATAAEKAADLSPTMSAGVATVACPAKNFWPPQLSERAASCLRAAQNAGGGMVKSIGIY